jgi:sulfur carrier protein
VNGAKEALAAHTVADLLAEKGVGERRGIAVALNGHVVLRKAWSATRLKAGDSIEIVHARQGG